MSLITTNTIPANLDARMSKMFGLESKERLGESVASMIFKDHSSLYQGGAIRFVSLTGTGYHDRKPEGADVTFGKLLQGGTATLTPVVYGKALTISRESFEDGIGESIAVKATKALAVGAAATRELVHMNVLNNAFTSTTGSIDGQALISASHPTEAGNFSNLETAAALSYTSLQTALTNCRRYKSNDGLIMPAKPKYLVVPPELEFVAHEVLRSVLKPNSMDNNINSIAGLYDLQVIVSPYLSSATAWFLVHDDVEDCLVTVDVRPLEMTRDNDFGTENLNMKVTHRFAVGFSDFRGITGNAGA